MLTTNTMKILCQDCPAKAIKGKTIDTGTNRMKLNMKSGAFTGPKERPNCGNLANNNQSERQHRVVMIPAAIHASRSDGSIRQDNVVRITIAVSGKNR